MPPVIIGPTVALIGLSLAGSAMGDMVKASGDIINGGYNLLGLLCGLVTFFVVVICSSQKKFKSMRLIPFIIGIGAGYALAAIFSAFGYGFDVPYLKIINWDPLVSNFVVDGKFTGVTAFLDYPHFALIEGIKEITGDSVKLTATGFAEIAIAFIPVAFVVFAEHIADHKNLSSIIGQDLVEGEPGLERTLLGDGVGSMVGTVFGICPNTTYGESVGCVAITKNASVITIFTAALMCIVLSFISPIMALLQTIPNCVMGGVCLTLYGFIAVSGLKMFKDIDLGENKNLFTVSAILIAGIGGLAIKIPYELFGEDTIIPSVSGNVTTLTAYAKGAVSKAITITPIATALILGICTNLVCNLIEKKNKETGDEEKVESIVSAPVEADSTYEVGSAETEEKGSDCVSGMRAACKKTNYTLAFLQGNAI